MSAAEETAEALVDVWVEEVRRLVPEVQAVREKYDRDSRAMDRNDSWPPLTEEDMFANWRRLWAAQHHLVWAAYQLERWVARLARERRQKKPKPDPVLADLRNALEHLDEADLDEFTAMATSNPARTTSLRKLPGGQLLIGTGGNPRRLFNLIDSAEIEERAWAVTTSTDRLEQEGEDYAHDLMARGEWPPWEPDDEEEG
ncbi:hypothetical protein [Trujillonella endophytica]|uniref:Uncharacterized protein n=1 Tax=Trujillonella endophytica TaxID=673521 RepID=A0A1H8WRF6_9ACTN|nr:hypothetical protein [Trujillella endophytica]SEP29678.1 hypothetical protein SAMN05660991_04622 [Trujillella endophytica]